MHNPTLERELAAHSAHNVGPLCWWRTLSAEDFAAGADVVEAALLSIVAVSRQAPDGLVERLTTAVEEERAEIWNDVSSIYLRLDGMQLGICAEIAASAAALSACLFDLRGLVTLLNMLSQPYTTMDPAARLATGATWLAERGMLLNTTSMAEIDWAQTGPHWTTSSEEDPE